MGSFLLRGGSFALAARLVAVVAGIAVQMVLARLLPPEAMGAYFLTQSVVAMLALLGQMGLHRTVVRHIAESTGSGRPERARGFVGPAYGLALVAIGVVAVAYGSGLGGLLASRVFESPAMLGAVLPTCAWVVGMGLQNVTAEILRGFHRIGAAALFGGALTSVLTIAALAALWWSHGEAEFHRVLWISAGGTFANLLLAGFVLGSILAGPRERPPDAMRLLLASAVPLAGATVLHTVFAQMDLWIVGGALPQDDVALYGAAKRLIRLVGLPLIVVNLVIPPLIAELSVRGESERLQRAIRGASTLAGVPAIAVLVVFMAAAAPILGLVYGEFYRQAALLLVIMSLERVVFVWTGPCSMVLMMTGHERTMLLVTVLCGIVAVVGAVGGVLLGGALGVAVGASLGSMVRNVAMWEAARRRTGVRTDVSILHVGDMTAALQRVLRR